MFSGFPCGMNVFILTSYFLPGNWDPAAPDLLGPRSPGFEDKL